MRTDLQNLKHSNSTITAHCDYKRASIMKNFVKCLKSLLIWLMDKMPIMDIIIIAFYVLFALIFRYMKGLLQWLKEEITIVDIIIIAFFVLFILIFRRFPNIDLNNLQFTIESILMLGALIFEIFFSVAKSKRKKQEKTENKETDKTPK